MILIALYFRLRRGRSLKILFFSRSTSSARGRKRPWCLFDTRPFGRHCVYRKKLLGPLLNKRVTRRCQLYIKIGSYRVDMVLCKQRYFLRGYPQGRPPYPWRSRLVITSEIRSAFSLNKLIQTWRTFPSLNTYPIWGQRISPLRGRKLLSQGARKN